MNLPRFIAIFTAALLSVLPAQALGPRLETPRRSVSTTGQFIIYCDDLQLRLDIGSLAEELKRGLLAALGLKDEWRVPLVITVLPERAALPGQPLSQVQLLQTEAGLREELNVTLGGDSAEAHFQQQLVRAILLEIAYRGRDVQPGVAYAKPPTWLVEGLTRYLQGRFSDADIGLFKIIVTGNHLPPLRDFLLERPREIEGVPLTMYRAYALSLVEILLSLPDSRGQLARFVQEIPEAGTDPAANLRKAFPTLGESDATLEKWWSLSLAKLAASDRYRGLNLAETTQRLAPLLTVDIPIPAAEPRSKKKLAAAPAPAAPPEMKTFPLADFPAYLKLKGSRAALAQHTGRLLELETLANPLLKPAISQYRLATAALAQGKTKGVAARIADADEYRELVLQRIDRVADYLNWFEGTQTYARSTLFDHYLRDAQALEAPPPHPPTAITRYLDVLEQQLR